MDTGFTRSGFPGGKQQSCLVDVVRRDVGTDIGFVIECACAHVSNRFGDSNITVGPRIMTH